MPLFDIGTRRVFFAHIPKTGGSSIKDYIVSRFGSLYLDGSKEWRDEIGLGIISPPQHLSARDLDFLLPKDVDYSFAIVRDPMDRLMSEYRFQKGHSFVSRLGFPLWLRTMLFCARYEPRVYDNHLRPQVDLIPDGCEIFRFEDGFSAVIAAFDALSGAADSGAAVPHIGKRKREEMRLSRQDADRVERFYAADYERFGYPRGDRAGLRSDIYDLPRTALAAVLARTIVWKQRRRWTR